MTWTEFNKPLQILSNKGGKSESLTFAYDAGRNRIYKKGNTETTWYVGGLYERTKKTSGNDAGKEVHKYYLKAGGQTVGYITQHKNQSHQFVNENLRYLLHDHLGSVTAVLNETGQNIQALSYNA